MRRLRLPLVLLALALPPTALATTVLRQSFDQLVDRSELAVHAVVDRVEARAVPGQPPFRLARLHVVDTLAGHAPATVFVRLPGGADDRGLIAHVAGVPDLAEGDEIVAFLERVPDAMTAPATVEPLLDTPGRSHALRAGGPQPHSQWYPIGFAYGTWTVEHEGGEAIAVRDPNAAGLRAVGEESGDLPPERISLGAMTARVRARRGPGAP
jgi:hypothetical protein